MSVVELNGHLLRQLIPVLISLPETPHKVPQRTGDQEIFLNKAQSLAETGGIVRIQHSRERFRSQSFCDRADEVTVAECFEIEKIGSRRGPQTEGVDVLSAKAHYRPVVGHTDQ